MNISDHSAAAAHYTGLLSELLNEQLVDAIKVAVDAQKDSDIALAYNLNNQEEAYFKLHDAREAFWAALDSLDIDRKAFREMVL